MLTTLPTPRLLTMIGAVLAGSGITFTAASKRACAPRVRERTGSVLNVFTHPCSLVKCRTLDAHHAWPLFLGIILYYSGGRFASV
jgi:hypothetical protein